MIVVIFEDNLMWSARLVKSLRALGHEAVVHERLVDLSDPIHVGIVNMGSPAIPAGEAIQELKDCGAFVIAHAGHKEKSLIEEAKNLGADYVATNSELTFKLEQLLNHAI